MGELFDASAHVQGAPEGGDRDRQRVALLTRQSLIGYGLAFAAPDLDVTVLAMPAPQALGAVAAGGFDAVILDSITAEGAGSETQLTRVLRAANNAPVIVLAEDADIDAVTDAVEQGARGYLTFDQSLADVAAAVRQVADGGLAIGVLPGSDAAPVPAPEPETADDPPLAKFSMRERDILARLARGQTTAQIAQEMGITVNTARTHIQNILGKLGMHSRVQAAAYAARNGLS